MILGGGSLGVDYVMTVEPSWMGLVPLKRDPRELPHPFRHVRHNEKSANWKRALTDHAGTLITDFQPPKLWATNFCCLWATQFVVLCYNSLNRLRQIPSVVRMQSFWNSHIALAEMQNGTFSHFGRTVWWFFIWLHMYYVIQQSYSRYLPKRNKNICPLKTSVQMFTAALFITVKN